jgi:sortase A
MCGAIEDTGRSMAISKVMPDREASVRNLPLRGNTRQIVSSGLVLVGIALLTYVVGSYAIMYRQQNSLMRQWEAQNARPVSPNDAEGVSDGLTRLSIPKIHLDVVIMEGTSHQTLAVGPGHLKNTAAPGQPGNAVIAAHRDTYFRKLYELKPGDDIYVQRAGRKYHYVVSAKRVVIPTDLSVLNSSEDSRLTLITCYPLHFIGPAPERLIVLAKLVKEV